MRDKLQVLVKRLKEEQRRLIVGASQTDAFPSNSTLERVAQLELNIAAIENTLEEERNP